MKPSSSGGEPFASRSLPELRAMIDALDHEILQLLARRNALVAEIAGDRLQSILVAGVDDDIVSPIEKRFGDAEPDSTRCSRYDGGLSFTRW